jgi:hypothetical protein
MPHRKLCSVDVAYEIGNVSRYCLEHCHQYLQGSHQGSEQCTVQIGRFLFWVEYFLDLLLYNLGLNYITASNRL